MRVFIHNCAQKIKHFVSATTVSGNDSAVQILLTVITLTAGLYFVFEAFVGAEEFFGSVGKLFHWYHSLPYVVWLFGDILGIVADIFMARSLFNLALFRQPCGMQAGMKTVQTTALVYILLQFLHIIADFIGTIINGTPYFTVYALLKYAFTGLLVPAVGLFMLRADS